MANLIDLSEDDGYVTVATKGGEIRVDLYVAFNKLLDIYNTHKGQSKDGKVNEEDLQRAQRAYFEGEWKITLGSNRQVVRLVDAIFLEVEKKSKEDKQVAGAATPPALLASTAPTL